MCAQDCMVAEVCGTVLLCDINQYSGKIREAVDFHPYTFLLACPCPPFPPFGTATSSKVAIEQRGQRRYYLASEALILLYTMTYSSILEHAKLLRLGVAGTDVLSYQQGWQMRGGIDLLGLMVWNLSRAYEGAYASKCFGNWQQNKQRHHSLVQHETRVFGPPCAGPGVPRCWWIQGGLFAICCCVRAEPQHLTME